MSLGALLVTVSRGAFVGLLVSCVWGTSIFRKRISFQTVMRAVLIGAVFLTVVLAAIGVEYGALLQQRIGGSFGHTGGDASSGRTQLWLQALGYLADQPYKMVTGFGWDMWSHMPFKLVSHNHYLDLWFNLGLIGLIGYVAILVHVVREVAAAAQRRAGTQDEYRYMGFVYGLIALSVSIFFVNLFTPWLFIWAYIALILRAAQTEKQTVVSAKVSAPVVADTGVRFGWSARKGVTPVQRRA